MRRKLRAQWDGGKARAVPRPIAPPPRSGHDRAMEPTPISDPHGRRAFLRRLAVKAKVRTGVVALIREET